MISVHTGPPELRAAALALKSLDKDLRRVVSEATRSTMGPVWKGALAEHATRHPDALVLAGARIAAGNPPTLIAGNSRRKVGRGLIPTEHWPAAEYGANRAARTTYDRTSPRGTRHKVTRRTQAQLRPRNKAGYVAGPAVAQVLPRLASLWVQAIVKTVMDAAEEGR